MITYYNDGISKVYVEGVGNRLYKNVIPTSHTDYIFGGVNTEVTLFIFGPRAADLVARYGSGVTNLISDVDYRRDQGFDNTLVRANGNPRDSKNHKRTGKTNICTSPFVRNYVLRNSRIFEIAMDFWGTNKLAFTKGIEPIIYKARGSEESLPTIDCKIREPLENDQMALNSFHYVTIVCISPGGISESGTNGALSILEGFDVHFEDIKAAITPYGKFPVVSQKNKKLDYTVLENLNVEGLNGELFRIHQATPEKAKTVFVPLKWKTVQMAAGDVIVFDCRIPYKTARNTTDVPALFVTVSLRPVWSGWYQTLKYKELQDTINHGKVGCWLKRIEAQCNFEEVNWRTSPFTLPGIDMKSVIDTKDFSEQDKLMFGIDRYSF